MGRAAIRLSPMPRNADQFFQFLTVISDLTDENDSVELELLIPLLTDKIRQENGNPYSDSNLKGVLRNIARFGLINHEIENDKAVVQLCVNLVDKDVNDLGDIIVDSLVSLGFDNDPYIIDMLFDYTEIVKESDEEILTNYDFMERTSSKSSEVPNGNPVSGYDYSELTKEGKDRAVKEMIKIIQYFGVLFPKGGGKYSLGSADKIISILSSLRGLKIERFVGNCISQIGPEHKIFKNKKSGQSVVSSFSKYICYRYSSGLGKHRTLANELLESLISLKDDFLSEYKSKKQGVRKSRTINALPNLISNLRSIIVEDLNLTHATNDFSSAFLSLATLERIKDSPENTQRELIRAESTGHKFSPALVEQSRHGRGMFLMDPEINLHTWQTEAANSWEANGNIGVVNAVTGTGKTIFAIECIRRFISNHPNTIVNIIVPTRVLMYQWAETVTSLLDLGIDVVGLHGDSINDSHQNGKKIMIRIVNSAVNKNSMKLDVASHSSEHHLLVADECHMYGGEKYRTFLEIPCTGMLGISATPPDELPNGKPHPIIEKMGKPIYTLNYRKAADQNLISPFGLRYVGLDLVPTEKSLYERLSKEMWNCSKEIENNHPWVFERGNMIAQLQQLLSKGEAHSSVVKYLELMRNRQDVVKNAMNRDIASKLIMEDFVESEGSENMMVFSERIREIRNLISVSPGWFRHDEVKDSDDSEFKDLVKKQANSLRILNDNLLSRASLKFGLYHSQFPPKLAKWMVNWYRDGLLNMMISAQALAQGFDVPGAEVGLIRSSSGNVRQRIQTIGRLIRKKGDKNAVIWILFVKRTGEEGIFSELDWESELPEGDDVQSYWELNENQSKLERIGGPESLPVFDRALEESEIEQIDVSDLEIGDSYPEPRIVHHSSLELIWRDHKLSFIDKGLEIDFSNSEKLEKIIQQWPMNLRQRCYACVNGHLVGRMKDGHVVYLGSIQLDEFLSLRDSSKSSVDNFDDFLDGFN
jgi:superfamily II DNA or RNA helicase